MTPTSINNLYWRPKLRNVAGEKMLVDVFDRLTQAPSTVMGEKHLSERSFRYRSVENRFSRGSLDGRILSTTASKCAV